jgi:hypothetical protein
MRAISGDAGDDPADKLALPPTEDSLVSNASNDLPRETGPSKTLVFSLRRGSGGPVPRSQELLRGLIPKRTVWAELVVLLAPSFDLGPCIYTSLFGEPLLLRPQS